MEHGRIKTFQVAGGVETLLRRLPVNHHVPAPFYCIRKLIKTKLIRKTNRIIPQFD